MSQQPKTWKTSYRCINNCAEESIELFAREIGDRVSIKLDFGNHRFSVYLSLEENEQEYLSRLRIRPHIYERSRVVHEHLHPYFADEARSILTALATRQQYVPSRIAPATGLPLTSEYGPLTSCTPHQPPDVTSRLRVTKTAPRPWPDAANAFLYAVTLLNVATEGSVVDGCYRRPLCATARHQ